MKLIQFAILALAAASFAILGSCCPKKAPAPSQPAYVAPAK